LGLEGVKLESQTWSRRSGSKWTEGGDRVEEEREGWGGIAKVGTNRLRATEGDCLGRQGTRIGEVRKRRRVGEQRARQFTETVTQAKKGLGVALYGEKRTPKKRGGWRRGKLVEDSQG